MSVAALSPDVLRYVFEFLDTCEVISVATYVSHNWRAAVYDTRRFHVRNQLEHPFALLRIVDSLSRFRRLVDLELVNFRHPGGEPLPIQTVVARHTSMQTLVLRGCAVDCLELTQHRSLTHLDVSACRPLSAPIITDVTAQHLVYLDLGRTLVSDFHVGSLPPLPALQTLLLKHTRHMKNPVLQVPSLTHLDVSYTPIIDVALDALLAQAPVRRLDMNSCPELRKPKFVAPHLDVLNATACKAMPSLTALRTTAPHLRILNLSTTHLQDEALMELLGSGGDAPPLPLQALFLTSLTTCRVHPMALRCVNLSFSTVEDYVVTHLCRDASSLEELRLEYCIALRNPTIESRSLETLVLSRTEIQGGVVDDILRFNPELRALYLGGCHFVNDITASHAAVHTLDIGGTRLTDDVVHRVVDWPVLRWLNITGCKALSAVSIRSTHLETVYCRAASIELAVVCCPSLRELDLSACPLTSVAVECGPQCVVHAYQVDPSVVTRIQRRLPPRGQLVTTGTPERVIPPLCGWFDDGTSRYL